MKGYIYLTTCLVNGKKYIGQSINQKDINTYLGSGIAFKCALKKYGKDMFVKTILINDVSCLNELNKLERHFIQKYDCIAPKGYNLDLRGTNISLNRDNWIPINDIYLPGYAVFDTPKAAYIATINHVLNNLI